MNPAPRNDLRAIGLVCTLGLFAACAPRATVRPEGEAVTPPPPTDPGESAKPRRKGHGRQQLPKHLPRDRRVYELSEAERLCHGCGQPRVVIGQEVSEQEED